MAGQAIGDCCVMEMWLQTSIAGLRALVGQIQVTENVRF